MGKLNTCAILVTIYIQILKIFFSFNQFVSIINQTPFHFHVIIHVFIWHTINMLMIKPIFNNCDDSLQVFHLQMALPQSYQYPNKTKHLFHFNLWAYNGNNLFGQKCHIWKLPFIVVPPIKRIFTCSKGYG